jgi:RNA polymerase sigma-70 factor (ECF subfamily)
VTETPAQPPDPEAASGAMRMGDVTRLLRAASSGERGDLDALMAAIYEDMRRLANSHLRRERAEHTLQPTALVHEAYVKLIAQHGTSWRDRLHFFAVASRIIRRILVDHARTRNAQKRGGMVERVDLDLAAPMAPERSVDLLALDEAMAELAEIDSVQAQVVELRFFGGMTAQEIGEFLGVSSRTVDRAWQCAQTWLHWRLTAVTDGRDDR